MKIIYGITKSNFGGAQRYVFDLARAARKAGHDVSVMCGGSGTLVEKLREQDIRVISIPEMQRDISLVDEFRAFHFIFRTLYEEGPDVFHTNSSKMGGIGNLAARFAGVEKIIFTSHGLAFQEDRVWWARLVMKFFTWLTFLLSHKVIVISRENFEWAKQALFVGHKVKFIYNGVENFSLLPREEARQELSSISSRPIPFDSIWIGTISELIKNKGQEYLFRALAEIKDSKWAFVNIGDGEDYEYLNILSQDLMIQDKVFFLGFVPEARKYLAAFDIFTLTSLKEGHPYVLLEAAQAKLPVLGSNISGIKDIVDDQRSGLLAQSKNPEDIKEKLETLIKDSTLRNSLGAALNKSSAEKFSINKMIEKTLDLY